MITLVAILLLIWLVLGVVDIWKNYQNKQEHPDGPGELQITIKEIER